MFITSIRSFASLTRRVRNPAVGSSFVPNIRVVLTLVFNIVSKRLCPWFKDAFVVLVLDVVEFAVMLGLGGV
jgi:hypothetical protein